MYSSLIENEEGRRVSGVFNITGDLPEQVNAHAATLWEAYLLKKHYDPNVVEFVKELGKNKPIPMNNRWKAVLERDFSHKMFTSEKLTKKKKFEDDMDEEDIDALVDDEFGDEDEDGMDVEDN